MGGGTPTITLLQQSLFGLSPRGRGNLGTQDRYIHPRGSIPAWAGEPPVSTPISHLGTVYPRVGGGTSTSGQTLSLSDGLSPRGRGNRYFPSKRSGYPRSIPAWAGEPALEPVIEGIGRVYPRVGGGTLLKLFDDKRAKGLSPRGRGNRSISDLVTTVIRSIPAWAGEPPHGCNVPVWSGVYPRVGGGTRRIRALRYHSRGLSPRGRGNRLRALQARGLSGSIPAWAGEPRTGGSGLTVAEVYPRVGGGTVFGRFRRGACQGLSPRGRGNPALAAVD